jgi:hypothetical protein
VLEGELDRPLRPRDGNESDDQPLLRKLLHELDEPPALDPAEQVGVRHGDVVEEQLAGVLALPADLVEDAAPARS